jgi:hypothetical protein
LDYYMIVYNIIQIICKDNKVTKQNTKYGMVDLIILVQ